MQGMHFWWDYLVAVMPCSSLHIILQGTWWFNFIGDVITCLRSICQSLWAQLALNRKGLINITFPLYIKTLKGKVNDYCAGPLVPFWGNVSALWQYGCTFNGYKRQDFYNFPAASQTVNVLLACDVQIRWVWLVLLQPEPVWKRKHLNSVSFVGRVAWSSRWSQGRWLGAALGLERVRQGVCLWLTLDAPFDSGCRGYHVLINKENNLVDTTDRQFRNMQWNRKQGKRP